MTHRRHRTPSVFWLRWLRGTTVGVMLFGIIMVVAPELTRAGFAWLVYADTNRLASFGPEAVTYMTLMHAVLGSVMVGWGAALLLVVRGPFARGAREGWQMMAFSLTVWFIPDTAFSLWSGVWQNAVLNVTMATLFAVPLTATYRLFHASSE